MSYRDDLHAAHERLRIVEKELAASRADDAADEARIRELEGKLAAASEELERLRRERSPSWFRRNAKWVKRIAIVAVIVGPCAAFCGWVLPVKNCMDIAASGKSDLATNETLCLECNSAEYRCQLAGDQRRAAGEADRARMLYRKGCRHGWRDACFELVDLDEANAVFLYFKACALGHMRACNNLGVRLGEGKGIAVDVAAARLAYRRACDAGVDMGCRNLGYSFENAEPRDLAAARELREQACKMGETESCEVAGRMHEQAGDRERAALLYREACDAKIGSACAALADLTPDAALAGELRRRACQHGHGASCP